MILFKSCRRCRGDLYQEEDDSTPSGFVWACLQCGATRGGVMPLTLPQSRRAEAGERRRAG